MTRNDIALEIASKLKLTQTLVKQVVQITLDRIVEELEKNGRLEWRNFGVFTVKSRKARKARYPRTGEVGMAAARKNGSFKAGKGMLDRLNGRSVKAGSKRGRSLKKRAAGTGGKSEKPE